MTPIKLLITCTFLAISLLGLIVFPIFIIMESRGNPILTRYRPEDTERRIYTLYTALGIDCVMFMYTIAYCYIDYTQAGRQKNELSDVEDTDL